MATYQSVIFQTSGAAGWSSVYYINAASLAAAMSQLQGINTNLLNCQATVVTTVGLRVSDVTIKGDGFQQPPTSVNGTLVITAPDTLAPINLAAVFDFWDSTFTHRVRHYVHGLRLSDTSTISTAETITTPVYRGLAGVTNYISIVQSSSVNWQKRSLPPVTAALTFGQIATNMGIRRVGRPFALFRGRRRTA